MYFRCGNQCLHSVKYKINKKDLRAENATLSVLQEIFGCGLSSLNYSAYRVAIV